MRSEGSAVSGSGTKCHIKKMNFNFWVIGSPEGEGRRDTDRRLYRDVCRGVIYVSRGCVKSLLIKNRDKFFTTETRRHGVLFSAPPCLRGELK